MSSLSSFRLISISLLHIVVKRVPNNTARFHFVFGSTYGPLSVECILRICFCVYLLSSKLCETFLYSSLSEVEFCIFWVSLG
jgi:hypothetical protein